MSDSGTTPPPPPDQFPHGQAPPQPPYQPPYQPYGAPAPGYAAAPIPYANWIRRVGGYVIDGLLILAAEIPGWILVAIGFAVGSSGLHTETDQYGYTRTTGSLTGPGLTMIIIGYALVFVGGLAVLIWNTFIKQGRTGYSIGKGVLGIKLIGEATGQPIGAGMAFVRQLCHILDTLACYLGWLWPLWDAKRQTFADKLVKTVVIVQPKP